MPVGVPPHFIMKNTLSLAPWMAGALFIAPLVLTASETDDRIESAARKSYVFKTYLSGDSIHTESREGVVTLTGTVAVIEHRTLAEDTVEGLPGVLRVDNQLKLKGEAPPEHSDTWLALRVKSALLFHRHVSATGTEVLVTDGIVTLRGEVSNLAQKDLTGEYAKDVEGVRDVKNELTVSVAPAKPAETLDEQIDDASITAQVKAALLAHRSTRSLKTKVSTLEGVVTVTGRASNDAEKSLVGKLVGDINGVRQVINQITVEISAASAK